MSVAYDLRLSSVIDEALDGAFQILEDRRSSCDPNTTPQDVYLAISEWYSSDVAEAWRIWWLEGDEEWY